MALVTPNYFNRDQYGSNAPQFWQEGDKLYNYKGGTEFNPNVEDRDNGGTYNIFQGREQGDPAASYNKVANPEWWSKIQNHPLIGGRDYADVWEMSAPGAEAMDAAKLVGTVQNAEAERILASRGQSHQPGNFFSDSIKNAYGAYQDITSNPAGMVMAGALGYGLRGGSLGNAGVGGGAATAGRPAGSFANWAADVGAQDLVAGNALNGIPQALSGAAQALPYNYASADVLGLTQMGQAAGLSGSALDSFVANGGTAGSTATAGAVDPFPSMPPIDYGMPSTGTPTGSGIGLTPTAPNGTSVLGTGGLAGAAGSTAVPGTLATGATAAIGGIIGSGTSVFDTFLNNLSNNPIQTAIKAAQVVSGITSGVNAMNAPMSPTDAQRMADPFASSRQQYIDKLNALMANPSLAMSQPGYQFALQQGMQELNRNLSKSGMGTSTPGFPGTPAAGAAGIAQQKYGQKFALKSYDDYVNQLSVLSGATQRPSVGSDASMNAQKAAAEAANSGWKSISQASGGLLDLFGGRSPQTGSTTNAPPVGGGTTVGGTWNNPTWYLNPPEFDRTVDDYISPTVAWD